MKRRIAAFMKMSMHRMSHRALCGALAVLWTGIAVFAHAQTSNRLSDPGDAKPSRWQAEYDRFDDQVRLRLLSVSDARSHYVAGRLDHLDIESAVRHFAAARVTAPQEKLYLAALAAVCVQPVQPTLPDCDAVDRLADWARRDDDNGMPMLWLADHARKRGDKEATIAYLEQAAAAPRFDEYGSRGMVEFWDYVQRVQIDADPAVRTIFALGNGATQPFGWYAERTCIEPAERSESLRAACSRLGATMAGRGSSLRTRSLGFAILERNAADAASLQDAQTRHAAFNVFRTRCAEALDARGALESADAAVRARFIREAELWVRNQAAVGEAAACARGIGAPAPP
jgi:hypothetical protein